MIRYSTVSVIRALFCLCSVLVVSACASTPTPSPIPPGSLTATSIPTLSAPTSTAAPSVAPPTVQATDTIEPTTAAIATVEATSTTLPTITGVPTLTAQPTATAIPPTNTAIPSTATTQATVAAPTAAPTQAPTAIPPTNAPAPPPAAFQATELVTVGAGILRLGSPGGQGFPDNEQPQHDVRMDTYAIEKYEVTNGQYAACVSAGGCTPAGARLNGDNFPVVNVNWNQANAYCTWIGRRLPNEAEWERAARGEDNWVYSWSNRPAPHFEWNAQFHGSPLSFCEASCALPHFITDVNDGYATSAPVGSFATLDPIRHDISKGFGAADMNGNVSEWVSNWFDPSAYAQGYPADVLGPSSGGSKVYRGGSWTTEPLRLATRFSLDPNASRNDLGFRCAQ